MAHTAAHLKDREESQEFAALLEDSMKSQSSYEG